MRIFASRKPTVALGFAPVEGNAHVTMETSSIPVDRQIRLARMQRAMALTTVIVMAPSTGGGRRARIQWLRALCVVRSAALHRWCLYEPVYPVNLRVEILCATASMMTAMAELMKHIDKNRLPAIGGCRASGITRCRGGRVIGVCRPRAPARTDAECDGVDNDCDQKIDEDFVVRPTTCGLGLCQREGNELCVDGTLVTDCTPAAPIDNDRQCDGRDTRLRWIHSEGFVGLVIG